MVGTSICLARPNALKGGIPKVLQIPNRVLFWQAEIQVKGTMSAIALSPRHTEEAINFQRGSKGDQWMGLKDGTD